MESLLAAFEKEPVLSIQVFFSEALKRSKDPKIIPVFIDLLKRESASDAFDVFTVRQNMLEGLILLNDPQANQTFVDFLEDDDSALRMLAVEGLAGLADPEGLQPLLDRLDLEPDEEVRKAIIQSISRFDEPIVVRKLVRVLKKEKDAEFRQIAIQSLGMSKDPRSTEPLLLALKEPDLEIQSSVIEALVVKGDTLSVDPLIEFSLADGNDSELKEKAGQAVRSIVEPLLLDITAKDLKKREASAKKLALIQDKLIAAPFLSALQREKSMAVRLILLKGLKGQNVNGKVDPLIGIFTDKREKKKIRRAAVDGLKGVIGPKVAPVLKMGLFEKDPKIRRIVVERMAESDLPEGISLLIEAFSREKRKTVREEIVKGLKGKKDPLLLPFFSELAMDKKERSKVRAHAADGLIKQGDITAVEVFSALLLEKKPSLRAKGVAGLAELRDPLSVTLLLKLLETEKTGRIRLAAVEALARHKSQKIIPLFVRILGNTRENFKLRKAAASYLQEHRVEEANEAFVGVLNGKDSALQKIAVRYLLTLNSPQLVDPFIALLSDRDSVLRNKAVEGLLINKDAKALSPLIAAQKKEKDPNVRKVMKEGVVEMIGYLGAVLQDGTFDQRKNVATHFSTIDDERLLGVTLQALEKEKKFSIRNLLTAGLKSIDDPRVFPVLITFLTDIEEDPRVRTNAAEGLRKALVPEAFDSFAKILEDPDPALRGIAATAISEYREKGSLKLLLRAIKTEKDPDVRVIISEGLKELKDPDLMETLIKVLFDLYEEPKVRQNAASGLRYMKDTQTVEPFIHVLSDEDPFIRLTAVQALNETADSRRVGPFIERLAVEREEKIRIAITGGLKAVNDPRVVPAFTKMVMDQGEPLKVRQNVAIGLSGIEHPEVQEVFRKTVFDSDPVIRGASAGALIKVHDRQVLRTVLQLLGREKEKSVRLRILDGLKGERDPLILDPLIPILANDEESLSIRQKAAEIIAEFENPLVVEPLRSLIKSEDPEIRLSVIKGLRRNLSSRQEDIFLQALRDGTPMIRYQATWALKELGWLQSRKKVKKVMKELNVPLYLKNAVTRGIYSKMAMGKGLGVKAIEEKGKEHPSLLFFLLRVLGDRGAYFEGKKRDKKLFVGERAATAIGGSGALALPHLLNIVANDRNEFARINATKALLGLKEKVAGEYVEGVLRKEKNAIVRANLLRLFSRTAPAGDLKILLRAFADKNEPSGARQVAGAALLKEGPAEVLLKMRTAMDDPDEKIREIAVEFLRRFGGDENVPYLLKGLKDVNQRVRYHAVSGLMRIQGFGKMIEYINRLLLPTGVKNALKKLFSKTSRARGLAINFLGAKGNDFPSVIPFLTSLLADESEYGVGKGVLTRITTPAREAEAALVKIGKPAVDSLVASMHGSRSDTIRSHAVKSLVKIDDPASVQALVSALKKEQNSSIRATLSERLMKEKGNSGLDDLFLKIVNERKDHWMVRLNAVRALKGKKGSQVINALLLALKDKDSVIRSAAAEGLVGVKNRKILRPLIRALDDEYAVVRYNAAQALKTVRSRKLKKLSTEIIEALDDLDPEVREKAAETLGVLKIKKAKKRLFMALRDPEAKVRKVAAGALALLKVSNDEDAATLLDVALRDLDSGVREAAITTLFLTKNSKVISTVYEAFQEEEWSVRENAVAVLKRLENPKAMKYMADAVSSKDKAVRLRLVEAFAYMGVRQLSVLASLVDDESVEVRRKVAWALGQTGSQSSGPPLARLMADRDTQVRRNVADSLAKVRLYDLMEKLVHEDDDYLVRKKCLEGMLLVNPGQKMLNTLYSLLTDRDVRIRKIAALGVGKFGNQFSVEHLVPALEGKWSGIRNEAAISLGNLKDPLALKPLFDAMESGNSELRRNVSAALEKITGEKGHPSPARWREIRKKMLVADSKESARLFVVPLLGALVVLLLL
ncbi:MAG: HEAT repeat domain-containing protein [Nitrospinota bacterium]